MKNFVQPGDVITLPVPAGGILSGQGMVVGNLFGIAAFTAAAGADIEVAVVGVFELPKTTGAIAAGARVYWDGTAKVVTTTATNNTLIGAASQAAVSAAPTVRVRLNGVSI